MMKSSLLFCLVFGSLFVSSSFSAGRPNILLILTDDQRADTIGALGNSIIRTPALDELTRRGTVMNGITCAFPVCTPSRTEILTGLTFMRAIAKGPQPANLAESLQSSGYHTWFVGKWHIAGRPRTRGYEESKGLFTSSTKMKLPPIGRDARGNPITGYRGMVFMDDDGNEFPERGIGLTPNISEDFADAAIELIRRKVDRPFFLHVNFTAPHDPRMTPRGYEDAYPPAKMPLPDNFASMPVTDSGNLNTRDERLLKKPLAPDRLREEISAYYALISHIDAQVGRMIEALRDAGQLERTIVIFTSDHGLALGSHGLLGKQNMYDHSMRVPFVLAGPGIPAGVQRAGLGYLRDLMATILDYCGVAPPADIDSASLRGVIEGGAEDVHPFVVGYYLDQSRMIQDRTWKLIEYPRRGASQLFNLEQDPLERHDLSQDKTYAIQHGRLKGQLAEWIAKHGEPGPIQSMR